MKDSVKLAATKFHRITGKEHKIEGFFYYDENDKRILIDAKYARHMHQSKTHRIYVDIGDNKCDTYENVVSNLYMGEEERRAMIRFIAGFDPYCDDPTMIIFDKQTGRVYIEKDFVPNPR